MSVICQCSKYSQHFWLPYVLLIDQNANTAARFISNNDFVLVQLVWLSNQQTSNSLFHMYSSICFQNLGYQLHLQQVKVYHYDSCRRQELLKLSCCNQWQNSQIIAAVHYFHNYHHHCYYHHLHYHRKMHLYRLRILLIIHFDCNMISCLFQLNFVCFLQKYIYIIHIFVVLFVLIFVPIISTHPYLYLLAYTYLHLIIYTYVLFILIVPVISGNCQL